MQFECTGTTYTNYAERTRWHWASLSGYKQSSSKGPEIGGQIDLLVGQTELLADIVAVVVHAAPGNGEQFGDLLGAHASPHQVGNLQLPGGQRSQLLGGLGAEPVREISQVVLEHLGELRGQAWTRGAQPAQQREDRPFAVVCQISRQFALLRLKLRHQFFNRAVLPAEQQIGLA